MKKRNLSVLIVALLIIALLAGCAGNQYQKQLDLGYKYLQEEKYEEAIVAMNKAIDIDDKRPEAYIGLGSVFVSRCDENTVADASDALKRGYEKSKSDAITQAFLDLAGQLVEKGKTDWAISLLDFGFKLTDIKKLDSKVKELRKNSDSDDSGDEKEKIPRCKKVLYYDADGTLLNYDIPEYNKDGQQTKWTTYDIDGSLVGYDINEYGANGHMSKVTYYGADKTPTGYYSTCEYDKSGKQTKWTFYKTNGETDYGVLEYNKDGKEIRETYYSADGTATGYSTIEYDNNGNEIKRTEYDAEGTMTGYDLYEYDKEGRLIKDIYYDSDGSLFDYLVYEY